MSTNNIIAQLHDNVNTVNVETIFDKWATKKSSAVLMSEKMKKAGFKERAFRMLNCSTQLSYYRCPSCGDMKIKRANLCRDKLCPVCSWRLSIQRYSNMAQIMKVVRERYTGLCYGFITLTAPNCYTRQLRAQLKALSGAWNRLTNRKVIKDNILGWARSVEITYNEKTDTAHPHYHIIAVARDNGAFKELVNVWLEVNRLGAVSAAQNYKVIEADKNIEMTQINDDDMMNAVLETFKYAVKSKDLDDMPLSSFRAFIENVNGMRMTSFGGILKTIKNELKLEFEEASDEEEMTICRNCGSSDLMEAIAVWSFDNSTYNRILINLYGK